jgi:hypothetical protein
MSELRDIPLTGTTDGAGAFTVDSPIAITGWLYAIEWIVGQFSAGVGGVISLQGTPGGSRTLLTLTSPTGNASAVFYPRDLVHDNVGAALLGASGGDRALPLLVGKPRLVVSSGGATKTGGCILYYYD